MLADVLFFINREVRLVALELGDAGPLVGGRGAPDFEDFVELVLLVLAGEQGSLRHDLGEDAADGPYVDRGVVVFRAHEDVGGPVPEGHDLVGEVLHGDAESSSQAEVSQLEHSLPVDEQVLGLEVSVQHLVLVALGDSIKQLVKEGLDLVFHEGSLGLVKELLEVLVEELEDECELLISVQHINQSYDVGVLELLEESNLPDGSTGNTLVLRLESDGLESVDLSGVHVPRLMNHSVSSLSNLLQLLVLIDLRLHASICFD
mmetsp:Transcript_5011/g.8544  ORF Transcript_5011/g.8544 Transcript_5011/m.8544 type:complete len:261 (-) Transcript_5011:25-807(-)